MSPIDPKDPDGSDKTAGAGKTALAKPGVIADLAERTAPHEVVLDLTAALGPTDAFSTTRQHLATKPYVPKHAREKTRTWLAVVILSLFGAMIVGPYVLIISKVLTLAEVKELMGMQFATVAGLAGSTIGFYFGSKPSTKADSDD